MALIFRRIVLASAAVASMTLVAACGQQNSYEAAEGTLQAWLAAVEDGDEAACELETDEYHEELVAENPGFGGREIGCATRVARMAAMDGNDAPPSADSEMDVPVWDPSGEALVEVADSSRGYVEKYWMIFEDGEWLVAGDEP